MAGRYQNVALIIPTAVTMGEECLLPGGAPRVGTWDQQLAFGPYLQYYSTRSTALKPLYGL